MVLVCGGGGAIADVKGKEGNIKLELITQNQHDTKAFAVGSKCFVVGL